MGLLTVALIILLTPPAAAAQATAFEREGVEYRLELPSPRWRAVARLDVHPHFDFARGDDPAAGLLRVRKIVAEDGATPEELFRRDETWTLKSLPGYVACSACGGEKFSGRLSGAVFSYEFTSGGRPMAGRVYYLRIDGRTYYTLHLTCERGELAEAGAQADSIARSFRLK